MGLSIVAAKGAGQVSEDFFFCFELVKQETFIKLYRSLMCF